MSVAFPARAAVYGIVKYPINISALKSVSSGQVSAVLCTGCEATLLKVNSASEFYEQNTSIELKRAVELFVKKTYPTVSLFIDTRNNTLTLIRFGEFLENQED